MHRSGRTARAGASGVVVSLIEPAATKDARKMQREVGIDTPIGSPDVRELRAPTIEPVAATAPERASASASAPAPSPKPASGRQIGTVTTFHDGRGYGFIDGGRDKELFVHQTNIATKVSTGQRVEFGVRPGRKGSRRSTSSPSDRQRRRLSKYCFQLFAASASSGLAANTGPIFSHAACFLYGMNSRWEIAVVGAIGLEHGAEMRRSPCAPRRRRPRAPSSGRWRTCPAKE